MTEIPKIAALQGPMRSINLPAVLAVKANGIPYIVRLIPTKRVLAPKSSINRALIASYIPAGKNIAAPSNIAPAASFRFTINFAADRRDS